MTLEKTKKFYIELSSKAVEVQKFWKPTIGDYYYRKSLDKIFLLTKNKLSDKKDCVWLPTEKQLFEKVCRKYGVLNWREFDGMAAEIYDYYNRMLQDIPSKEICGLGAIMFHFHQKLWKEGEWVKG